MILRGQNASIRTNILHWLILSAMSIGKLIGFCTTCERKELISEADSEDRFFHSDRLLNLSDRWKIFCRITRPIRDKNPIVFQIFFREWKISWNADNIESKREKNPKHIIFYPHIDDEKCLPDRSRGVIENWLRDTHFVCEQSLIRIREMYAIRNMFEENLSWDSTMLTNVLRDGTCIDPFDRRDLLSDKKVCKRLVRFIV